MWLLADIIGLHFLVRILRLLSNANAPVQINTQVSMMKLISETEIKLDQLRSSVTDLMEMDYENTNEYLLGWLEHNGMDIKAAEEMLRKVKKWRKENQMDSIVNETVKEISHSQTCSLDLFDKDGDPVLTCVISGIDLRNLLLNGQKKRVFRYFMQWFEKFLFLAREVNKKRGKFIKHPLMILDFGGFNLKQHSCFQCIEMARELQQIGIQNYPRALTHLIVINVPKIAVPIARTFLSMLTEFHRNHLKIFGGDKKEYLKFLLQYISWDDLARKYGLEKNEQPNAISEYKLV